MSAESSSGSYANTLSGYKGCIVGSAPSSTTSTSTTTTTTTASLACPDDDIRMNRKISVVSNRNVLNMYQMIYVREFTSLGQTDAGNMVTINLLRK